MRIDILTVVPELLVSPLNESILKRAQEGGFAEIHIHNIRDYSKDKHRKVDDTPYGGGVGMVMACEPIYDCYTAIKRELPEGARSRVIYMSPKGRRFTHEVARELSEYDSLIFLCASFFTNSVYKLKS